MIRGSDHAGGSWLEVALLQPIGEVFEGFYLAMVEVKIKKEVSSSIFTKL